MCSAEGQTLSSNSSKLDSEEPFPDTLVEQMSGTSIASLTETDKEKEFSHVRVRDEGLGVGENVPVTITHGLLPRLPTNIQPPPCVEHPSIGCDQVKVNEEEEEEVLEEGELVNEDKELEVDHSFPSPSPSSSFSSSFSSSSSSSLSSAQPQEAPSIISPTKLSVIHCMAASITKACTLPLQTPPLPPFPLAPQVGANNLQRNQATFLPLTEPPRSTASQYHYHGQDLPQRGHMERHEHRHSSFQQHKERFTHEQVKQEQLVINPYLRAPLDRSNRYNPYRSSQHRTYAFPNYPYRQYNRPPSLHWQELRRHHHNQQSHFFGSPPPQPLLLRPLPPPPPCPPRPPPPRPPILGYNSRYGFNSHAYNDFNYRWS